MTNYIDHDECDVPMESDINDVEYGGSRFDLEPVADGYAFTGIDPIGLAGDGREIVIINISSLYSVTLSHDSSNSTEGNRLFFADDIDHVLGPHEMVWGVRIEAEAGRVGWWMQF